jgi:hypothetical protein
MKLYAVLLEILASAEERVLVEKADAQMKFVRDTLCEWRFRGCFLSILNQRKAARGTCSDVGASVFADRSISQEMVVLIQGLGTCALHAVGLVFQLNKGPCPSSTQHAD